MNNILYKSRSMQTLGFDDNHLLTIEHPNLSTTKDYAVSFPSYIIKSKDKGILIFNKRQWKILHLKEISEWMQVCYLQENPIENYEINKWMIVNALAIFQWFNEETWEKYYYLPFFSKWIGELQQIINNSFGFDVMIKKESQGTFIRNFSTDFSYPKNKNDILSFLFALVLLYWNFEEKKWELSSIKIHIPVVWAKAIDEEMENICKNLAHEYWIFISSQRLQQWWKSIFQCSSNDSELLSLFNDRANSYLNKNYSIEKYEKKQQEIKQQLIEYIKNTEELSLPWREEVVKEIMNNKVKFIKYC